MRRTWQFLACAFVAAGVRAADITLGGNDAGGKSSFNTGENWPGGLAPEAGNNYFVPSSRTLRTPEGTDSYVFAGDRLTINSGGVMAWKSTGPVTITDLVLTGTLGHWQGNLANDAQLYGAITIPLGATGRFECSQTENDRRVFLVHSAISGSGDILVVMGHTNAVKGISLLGDNSGFTGRVILRGFHTFNIYGEEALGAVDAIEALADEMLREMFAIPLEFKLIPMYMSMP